MEEQVQRPTIEQVVADIKARLEQLEHKVSDDHHFSILTLNQEVVKLRERVRQ